MLLRQKGLLDRSNEQLAQKSAKVVDLLTLCLELRVEAATARWEVAPLVEKVRSLEENLQKVSSEQEELQCQAGSLTEAQGLWTQMGGMCCLPILHLLRSLWLCLIILV
jgi:chromosome segregation ATPase